MDTVSLHDLVIVVMVTTRLHCDSVKRRHDIVLIIDLVQSGQHELLEKFRMELFHVVFDILHPYVADVIVEKESPERAASGCCRPDDVRHFRRE